MHTAYNRELTKFIADHIHIAMDRTIAIAHKLAMIYRAIIVANG